MREGRTRQGPLTVHRAAVLSFAAEVERGVPTGRGGTQLRRVTDFASSQRAEGLHSDYLALAAALRRGVRHRSLLVLLTALPDLERQDLLRALRMLAPQHLPPVVVLTDPELRAAAQTLPADKPELLLRLRPLPPRSGPACCFSHCGRTP